jgi:hypothetical protein
MKLFWVGEEEKLKRREVGVVRDARRRAMKMELRGGEKKS